MLARIGAEVSEARTVRPPPGRASSARCTAPSLGETRTPDEVEAVGPRLASRDPEEVHPARTLAPAATLTPNRPRRDNREDFDKALITRSYIYPWGVLAWGCQRSAGPFWWQ
ncbi:hypothetical protein GCM10027572_11770 [Flexivirga lutea]